MTDILLEICEACWLNAHSNRPVPIGHERFSAAHPGYRIMPIGRDCGGGDAQSSSCGHYSGEPCECCGDWLAGPRFAAVANQARRRSTSYILDVGR